MRIGGLDRFFQVNVNTLATIPLKGILVLIIFFNSIISIDIKHNFIDKNANLDGLDYEY
jgi:hypothetical protein